MALLVLPLALSAVKSRGAAHFGLLVAERQNHSRLCRPFGRRYRSPLPGRRGVKAMSFSAVSQPQSRDSKPEGVSTVLTFQQAIQRLQVWLSMCGLYLDLICIILLGLRVWSTRIIGNFVTS